MNDDRLQFGSLYLTRFASSFGFIAVLTLLPTYINIFQPSGLVVGLFTTSLTVAQTAAVIPLAWVADRYDKRTVLLGGLLVSVLAYVAFALVSSSVTFVGSRVLQGVGAVGTGLVTLALVGELAPADSRGTFIGRYNAVRMAGGIAGTLGAGVLYDLYGFVAVFGLLVAMLFAAAVGVLLFVERDETSVERASRDSRSRTSR